MEEKIRKEWFLKTKWGKIAMISWGDRHRPGVLLVHGYMDSAACFEPLMSRLPNTHHYVAFDMPGHGKSDHVSTSLLVSQLFIVEIIKEIVKYLQWKSFVCISHSMGILLVLVYNYLYPGRIKKVVNLDPIVAALQNYYLTLEFEVWYKWFFENYYDQYHLYNGAPPRLFTRDRLIESTMKARNFTREQAEVVLSRSLVPVENGMYRISTQPIMRKFISVPAYRETFQHILTHKIPPALNLHGKKMKLDKDKKKYSTDIFAYESPNRTDIYFDAGHDLHVTHPDEIAPYIIEFLSGKSFKAKL